jgi:hypothetical protein
MYLPIHPDRPRLEHLARLSSVLLLWSMELASEAAVILARIAVLNDLVISCVGRRNLTKLFFLPPSLPR